MPTIRFIRDVVVVTALPSGKNRKTKIPRGAQMEVTASSAAWRVEKGDAEIIATAAPGVNFIAARAAAAPRVEAVSATSKLVTILADVKAGLWEKVYEAFSAMEAREVDDVKRLSEDAHMILGEAISEIQRDGALSTISSTDLVDALEEVAALDREPAGVPPLAPLVPLAAPAATPTTSARQRRPKAS